MFGQMYMAVAITLIFAVAMGQVIQPGQCKDYPTKENFRLGPYMGSWYDIQKFYFAGLMNRRCVMAEYYDNHDGTMDVINSDLTPEDHEENITGKAYYKDISVKSKLTVQLADLPEADYWVIDTDYISYSIVWSCLNLPTGFQAEFAWILGRNRTMDPTVLARAKQKLENIGIDSSHFTATNQHNCWRLDAIRRGVFSYAMNRMKTVK